MEDYKLRFLDFEVTPNWWLCVFGDYPKDGNLTEAIKNTFIRINSDMPNARDLLISLMKEKHVCNVGYNLKGYDLIIANAVYQGFSPQQIKIINDLIINPGCAYETKEHMRMIPFSKRKLSKVVYQDLLDDNDGSLKEKEAILGLNIQESNVDFNTEFLTEHDKLDLTEYCDHDVYAEMVYYEKVVKGYVLSKLNICKNFNIPVEQGYTCTNANLVSKALGAVRTSFNDVEELEIFLPEKIKQYCYDNVPSKILDCIRTSKDPFNVTLFENIVNFGNGGVHSTYLNNLYVESNDEWCLMNVDAASYYPSMLIQFNCLSRAVRNPKVFKDIFDERIELKHKPNKTKDEQDAQDADKLILNTTFGASGNKYLDLYDPYMCTRCCRLGQIFLVALANKLYKSIPDIKIIQTNTDGILIYFKRKHLDLVRKLEKEWSDISGINMEEDDVEKIWQRDVNNYLMIKKSKKGYEIKRKGLWLMDTWTKPGYFLVSPLTGYVSQKAAIEWLINRKDIVESVVNNKNILDFAITCKKGPSYRGVIHRYGDGTEKMLHKCNRIFATTDKQYGKLYKYKMYKGEISYTKMPNTPEHCKLINDDLSTYDFDVLKKEIDYMYYISKAMDLIDIEWTILEGNTQYTSDKFKYL